MQNSILNITDTAAEQIKILMAKRSLPALGIRVGVKTGGCSGRKYYIEYAENQDRFDEVITDKGVTVLIDRKAIMYLIGSEMDYTDEQFKSGFVFNNPNEKASCGCGKSFSV